MLVWGVQRDLPALARASFDVLVIGGGIVGACVARDAVLRGLNVALIDRGDFGGGISWNSLKVVHGGLRSLQRLDLRQARHFVRERRAWLRIAPHLVEPLSFVVPTRGFGRESALVIRAGLALNDLLSSDRNNGIGSSRRLADGRRLSRDELRALVPSALDGYSGGALFRDAQLYSSERLIIAVLEDAVRAGAIVANYVEAAAPVHARGALSGASVIDRLGSERFDVRASMVVNAAGASAPALADRLTGRVGSAPPMSGIALNLVLEGDPAHSTAFTLTTSNDGSTRRLFVVPWRGRTLVGTAHYACERTPATKAELEPFVARFVRAAAAAWPARRIERAQLLLVHAGMQPHAVRGSGGTPHGPPGYLIVDHSSDGVPQLLTAIGPKLTTSRAIAETLTDAVCARIARATNRCETAIRPLASAPAEDVAIAIQRALAGDRAGLPEDVITHLVRSYGADYASLLATVRNNPALGARVEESAPVIAAQFVRGVREEMAMTTDDLIERRTELGSTAHAGRHAHEIAAGTLANRAELP